MYRNAVGKMLSKMSKMSKTSKMSKMTALHGRVKLTTVRVFKGYVRGRSEQCLATMSSTGTSNKSVVLKFPADKLDQLDSDFELTA